MTCRLRRSPARKERRAAERAERKRKPGKQPGAPGAAMRWRKADEVVDHLRTQQLPWCRLIHCDRRRDRVHTRAASAAGAHDRRRGRIDSRLGGDADESRADPRRVLELLRRDLCLRLRQPSLAVSASASSYTAQCLTLKSAGAQAVFTATDINTTMRFIANCSQQGYKPIYIDNPQNWSSADTTNSAWQGSWLAADSASWLMNNSVMSAYRAAMAKYEPNAQTTDTSATAGWVAGDLRVGQAGRAEDLRVVHEGHG
jgi:Periplasmic binding protein